MFDSLDDQMKRDEHAATTSGERMMRWAMVAVASILLFGGLYWGVHLLE